MARKKWEIEPIDGEYLVVVGGAWIGLYPSSEAAEKAAKGLVEQPLKTWEVGCPGVGRGEPEPF